VLPLLGRGVDASDGSIEAVGFYHAARNHYFVTTEPAEAAMIDAGGVGHAAWLFEGLAFRAAPPVLGQCAAGFDPVVRLYWNGSVGTDMRHRYAVDPDVVHAMADAGWIVEGPVFCSPH
jgi:hypothetical protein